MKFSNTDHISRTSASSIGSKVSESLSDVQRGKVFGKTSRGIFIKTAGKWLNFLSFERFRGPLTINLLPDDEIPDIKVGMELQISPHNLFFPEAGWEVSLTEAEVWRPLPATGTLATRVDRQARMIALAKQIMENNSDSGLAPLLPRLLKTADQREASNIDRPRTHEQIFQLHQEMNSAGSMPPSSAVVRLLGSGMGLTPSGDDFIIGLLLPFNRWSKSKPFNRWSKSKPFNRWSKSKPFNRWSKSKPFNRWKGMFPNVPELEQFNHQIVEAAYQKTTTLSANLIECAVLGLGDERLIDALDWLVGGSDQDTTPGDQLLTWGSSSGIDVFVGYVVALSI